MIFQKTKKFILDTLFPIYCLFCQEPDSWLCDKCLKEIEIISSQVCPYCEKNATPSGRICSDCKANFLKKNKTVPLDGLFVSTSYKDSGVFSLIYAFKYNFIEDLGIPLGELVVKSAVKNNITLPDMIIPVPLHSRRLRWRGFNQAEIIASYVGKNISPGFSIPVLSDVLIRKKYTIPQMKIKNYQDRQKNIKKVFGVKNISLLKNKKVLLIDDISTTGATILECAGLLKQNGAHSVFGAVIARQEFESHVA